MNQKLIELAKKIKNNNNESLPDLIRELREFKLILLNFLIEKNINDVKGLVSEKPDDAEKFKEKTKYSMDLLKNTAQSKEDQDVTYYLLYRDTKDYDYQDNESSGIYSTEDDTLWFASHKKAYNKQTGENPVIACWIPESSIKELTPFEPTGNFGELVENNHKESFQIIVKPGSFDIYSEYKG